MQACPYDALYIDPNTHTAAKCNYCAHRIDKGLEPACVNVCPTQAIISGDLDDPESRISKLKSREVVSVRKPEKGTQPALFYIDGDRDSLEPTATSTIGQSLWSQQNAGVGHYAKFVESRVAEKGKSSNGDGSHVLDQLKGLLDLGDKSDGVLNPDPSNAKTTKSAVDVKQEVSKRVYDSPNKGVLWGWQVSAYVWTKAISAGAALVPCTAALFGFCEVSPAIQWTAIVVSLLFLGITGYLLTIDLDQPKRFLYVLLRPQWKSWLVRGAYIITAYSVLLLLWPLLGIFHGDEKPGWVIMLLLPASAMTAIYTAFLFAQAKGRDFWQSPLLSVHMLLHAGIAGAAIFAVLLPASGVESWQKFIPQTLISLLAAKLIVDWFELSTTHATADSKQTAKSITNGKYSTLYWFGVVLAGCAVPIGLLLIGNVWAACLAGLIALGGLYIAEHIWVRAPQQLPLS